MGVKIGGVFVAIYGSFWDYFMNTFSVLTNTLVVALLVFLV